MFVYMSTWGIVRWMTRGLSFVSHPKDRDATRSRKYGNSHTLTFQFWTLTCNLPITSPSLYRLSYQLPQFKTKQRNSLLCPWKGKLESAGEKKKLVKENNMPLSDNKHVSDKILYFGARIFPDNLHRFKATLHLRYIKLIQSMSRLFHLCIANILLWKGSYFNAWNAGNITLQRAWDWTLTASDRLWILLTSA